MSMADVFWYAWPWVGLGMGIVMLVLLFATDLLRGSDAPRVRDPYWLAYLEAYGGSAAPEWTGGEYDHTQNTAYQQYLKDWADAHAPEYAGDPYKARRDAAANTRRCGTTPFGTRRT